jgi:alkylation response protein AidB-like acyl-CoA dehydrogenase
MDFSLSASQKELYDAVVAFARDQLGGDVVARDRDGTFWREGWTRLAGFGLTGLPVPREYGGQGAGLLDTLLAMEALGYGCPDNGLVFSLNAQLWSCMMPLAHYGTEEQKRRWLPPLCDGTAIGVHAITEPEGGSDAFAGLARARRSKGGDGYVVNGRKTFITNGPVADVIVVFARLEEDDGTDRGLTAFVVQKGDAGLVQSAPFEKMGLRTSPLGEVVLDDCRVSADRRLGPEGVGEKVFHSSMEWERTCIFASHLGQMERQLEESIRYARGRKQFGRPIAKYTPIADKLVDAKVRIEAGRWLLYRTGWLKDQGKSSILDASIAKLFVSEAHVESALDAIQIHGGYGYMVESGVERELRDAVGGTIYSGTSEMQRKIIAGFLGL